MKKKQQGEHFLRSHRKNQTREDRNKQKTHSGKNKSASLTPAQGPSTVVCMIVT
jgi:hypothetical protein